MINIPIAEILTLTGGEVARPAAEHENGNDASASFLDILVDKPALPEPALTEHALEELMITPITLRTPQQMPQGKIPMIPLVQNAPVHDGPTYQPGFAQYSDQSLPVTRVLDTIKYPDNDSAPTRGVKGVKAPSLDAEQRLLPAPQNSDGHPIWKTQAVFDSSDPANTMGLGAIQNGIAKSEILFRHPQPDISHQVGAESEADQQQQQPATVKIAAAAPSGTTPLLPTPDFPRLGRGDGAPEIKTTPIVQPRQNNMMSAAPMPAAPIDMGAMPQTNSAPVEPTPSIHHAPVVSVTGTTTTLTGQIPIPPSAPDALRLSPLAMPPSMNGSNRLQRADAPMVFPHDPAPAVIPASQPIEAQTIDPPVLSQPNPQIKNTPIMTSLNIRHTPMVGPSLSRSDPSQWAGTADRFSPAPVLVATPATQHLETQTANSLMPVQVDVPTPPQVTSDMIPLENIEPLETPDFLPVESRAIDSIGSRLDTITTRPEMARHVAQQLAEVARQMPDRPIELTLNPEELGRVRLTFTMSDGGISVAVIAERGETMDLLRRHIDTLAQEFRDMGYKDVNFEFSRNGQGDAGGGDANHDRSANSDTPSTETGALAPVQLSLEPSTGLDLRL